MHALASLGIIEPESKTKSGFVLGLKNAEMIIIISLNLLIALIGFYVAWKVWRLQRTLAKVAEILIAAERNTDHALQGAPQAIIKGQLGVYQLRQAYRQSGPQFQRVRQALLLLGLGRSLVQQPNRFIRPLSRRSSRSILKN
jgi:hypothetical protein